MPPPGTIASGRQSVSRQLLQVPGAVNHVAQIHLREGRDFHFNRQMMHDEMASPKDQAVWPACVRRRRMAMI